MRNTIFAVDDSDVNLTKIKQALEDQYRIYPLPSASAMFTLLKKIVPEMILLDIEMPEINGYEAIKKIKADARFADIPVVFLTARIDEVSEMEGFDLGAVDYIIKPFSTPVLRKRVASHLLIASQKKELLANREAL
ncbi:MAG: response regulator, partial [Deltaproteobacteria bacterium]|nr:response regulator [Deltaproteobacteria bacterium]